MGIDEFGRIGSLVLKAAIKKGAAVVVINDPVVPLDYRAYMFKYDSAYGKIKNEVCENEQSLYVIGNKVTVFNGHDLANIDWSSAGAEYVESTEEVTITDKAFVHTKEKAENVTISAPSAIDVVVVNLTVKIEKEASYEDICAKINKAFEGSMNGILDYTDESFVSIDFVGDDRSSIFDAKAEIQLSKTFVKFISGFDNEKGYFNRARITSNIAWTQCAIIKVVLTRVKPDPESF